MSASLHADLSTLLCWDVHVFLVSMSLFTFHLNISMKMCTCIRSTYYAYVDMCTHIHVCMYVCTYVHMCTLS